MGVFGHLTRLSSIQLDPTFIFYVLCSLISRLCYIMSSLDSSSMMPVIMVSSFALYLVLYKWTLIALSISGCNYHGYQTLDLNRRIVRFYDFTPSKRAESEVESCLQ